MTEAASTAAPTVLVHRSGRAGRLTLNRPKAINALDLDMIGLLRAALESWRHDPSIELVILDGAGERGLCAGGDVRGLYGQIVEGRAEDTAQFFRAEYALNAAIGDYPKPVVALADGITMGGGIGLAGHAAIRVVTERSRLAMPETRIGFTPDVGGTWLLAHAPGRLGEYLGVTGSTMDAADALYAGFADVHVPADALGTLRVDLETSGDDVRAIVDRHATDAGPPALAADRSWIDDAFACDTVPGIIARLRAVVGRSPGAAAAVETVAQLSPMAMAVTLEAVRRARGLPDLRAALAQEYGLVMWFAMTRTDLVEGIRAQLIDKDRSPAWTPATPDDVPADAAASALSFAPPVPLWG